MLLDLNKHKKSRLINRKKASFHSNSLTSHTRTTCSTDTMNIFIDICWQVKVNDMFNISREIQIRRQSITIHHAYEISRPRAATLVATRIGVRALLNDRNASSR